MITVNISQGSLCGGKSVTDSGFEYYKFLGIPYAKPPVGKLRFQSPQPPESWDGVRDATQFDRSNVSCQMSVKFGDIMGSEDCLYLNVYTPEVPSPRTSKKPVLLYIHGGGFMYGNGTLRNNDPDYFIENGIVVVTINYRVGVMGFLALDIPEATGNMGLKDQVKALEWVKNNISDFGGDKNKVTIMGISAGAAAVDFLLLSPMAKGLFHGAILLSGSTLNHWAITFKPMGLTRQLLKNLDYKGSLEDKYAIYEYFRTISVEELIPRSFAVSNKYVSDRFFFGFGPTIEKDFGNGDAFLTVNPYKLLKSGKFNTVPAIRGFCSKEGAITCTTKVHILKELKENQDFAKVWPCEFDSKVKDHYNTKFSSLYFTENGNETWEDFFGDIDFIAGIWIAAKLSSRYAPVYLYKFSYDGSINFYKKMMEYIPNTVPVIMNGAMHADDFTYVMKFPSDLYKDPNEHDILVRKRMVKMFTDFVKTGEPVRSTNDLIKTNWEPFNESSPVYLGIDKELFILKNYEPKKMALFEELYEKYYEYSY